MLLEIMGVSFSQASGSNTNAQVQQWPYFKYLRHMCNFTNSGIIICFPLIQEKIYN